MEAARRALTLDERLPEAHHALAMVRLWMDWNWTIIEREFMRALALNPNAALTGAVYCALGLAAMRRDDAAVREAECAAAIDPLSAILAYLRAMTYCVLRRLPRGIEELQKALALDPLLCTRLVGDCRRVYGECPARRSHRGCRTCGDS